MLCIVPFLVTAQKTKLAANTVSFKGLDTAFARVLKSWHAAGFAVAVVQKNKVIYSAGFGYRDIARKLPATTNTLYAIGSCTKAFTASLIGKLQQDGKLDIDVPVHNYLPALKFYNENMTNTITLRDMMSHVTGLPRHDMSWYFFNSTSTDSLVQRVQYLEPTYGVRQRWQYNNFMYAAQGDLIEKISGKSWEENIRGLFFVPLGMSRSNVNIPEMEKADNIAIGYGLKKDSILKKLPYFHIDGMAPAGAVNSSVNDMAKWLIAWINNGKYQGNEIIPSWFRDQAISSQAVMSRALPQKEKPGIYFADYGFGWMLRSYKGHYQVEHGGNIDGFTASTCFFPADSIGIVVLTNQEKSSVPTIVVNLLVDRVLGFKYFDWNGNLKNDVEKAKKYTAKIQKETAATVKRNPPTHKLTDYTGNFNNPGYGTFNIYQVKDSLFAKTTAKTLWLRPANYDVFDVFENDPEDGIDTAEKATIKIQFKTNIDGDIDGLESQLEESLKPIIFSRVNQPKSLTAAQMQKYIGGYNLSGASVKFYIKDDKTLYVSIPGQPDYELIPIGEDKFSIRGFGSGYCLQFGSVGADKITQVTFIQPEGHFVAIKN